jgi:hypothetical protein
MADGEFIDPVLYERLSAFMARSEKSSHAFGQIEILHDWLDLERLDEDDRWYLVTGAGYMIEHPEGEGWDKGQRRPDLDVFLRTFFTVWGDRYGDVTA